MSFFNQIPWIQHFFSRNNVVKKFFFLLFKLRGLILHNNRHCTKPAKVEINIRYDRTKLPSLYLIYKNWFIIV